MKSFGLSSKDGQDKDDWRLREQLAKPVNAGKWPLKWCAYVCNGPLRYFITVQICYSQSDEAYGIVKFRLVN